MENETLCLGCYPLNISNCEETFKIPTGLESGQIVWGVITDKFNNEYRIKADVDENGNITLEKEKFPKGLFTPYSGSFKFVVVGIGETEPVDPVCANETLTICDKTYSCVSITVVNRQYSDHTNPPPPSECVCGWAFGSPDTQRRVLSDGDVPRFQWELFATDSDYSATGELVEVQYALLQYENGVVVDTMTGSLEDGESTNITMDIPENGMTIQAITTSIFSDGAETITTRLYELTPTVDNSADIVETNLDNATFNFEGCDTINAEIDSPRIDGNEEYAIRPAFVDGSEETIEEGTTFNGQIETNSEWRFDFGWVFGIDNGQWRDLPDESENNFWAGIGMKFVTDC